MSICDNKQVDEHFEIIKENSLKSLELETLEAKKMQGMVLL